MAENIVHWRGRDGTVRARLGP